MTEAKPLTADLDIEAIDEYLAGHCTGNSNCPAPHNALDSLRFTLTDLRAKLEAAEGTEADLLAAIKTFRPDFHWNESPAEIVGYLADDVDALTATIADRDKQIAELKAESMSRLRASEHFERRLAEEMIATQAARAERAAAERQRDAAVAGLKKYGDHKYACQSWCCGKCGQHVHRERLRHKHETKRYACNCGLLAAIEQKEGM